MVSFPKIRNTLAETGRKENSRVRFGYVKLRCLTGIREELLTVLLDIQVWSSEQRRRQKLKLGIVTTQIIFNQVDRT